MTSKFSPETRPLMRADPRKKSTGCSTKMLNNCFADLATAVNGRMPTSVAPV